MKVEIMDQELIARLAKQCIEAGAGYSPGETVSEWYEKAQGVLGERNVPWPAGEVFRFMRDTRHASVEVNPRGSEGEDLASSHAGAETNEPRQRYFVTFREGDGSTTETEVPKDAFDLYRVDPPRPSWIISWRTEPAKGAVSAPLPLVPSDGEDVAKEVDVPLDTSLCHDFQSEVAPLREVTALYCDQWELRDGVIVAKEGVDTLYLEPAALLGRADLIPVPLKSFSERLTGYRPTLHGQNLGLSLSTPETRSGLGLEHARLANSIAVDVHSPSPAMLVDVRHVGQPVGQMWGVQYGSIGSQQATKGRAK